VPDRRDAKVLQRLVRQARQDCLVYVILAECRLILPEAPSWPYSSGWGYYPGGGIGLILIIVVVLILVGRI
jgi:hypothetical protein